MQPARPSSFHRACLLALLTAFLADVVKAELALPDLDIGGIGHTERTGSVARFEPSSPAVVQEMLRIADVTGSDLVYDLGSGDGRTVIAAASMKGARGVGIDLDAELVRESRRNADRANVTGLVRFIEGDIFEETFADATVVMLFLSPEGNLKLRSRLLRQLKPGARIVSHSHSMGEWKPDRESQAEGDAIYLWIVPADVAGLWSFEITDKYAEGDTSIRFEQRFQEITARLRAGRTEAVLSGTALRGKILEFTLPRDIGSLTGPVTFRGKVQDSRMSGTYRSKQQTGSWTAKRTKPRV